MSRVGDPACRRGFRMAMSQMPADEPRSESNTISFLRTVALELRQFAEAGEWGTEDAARARHIADKCDKKADKISQGPTADT